MVNMEKGEPGPVTPLWPEWKSYCLNVHFLNANKVELLFTYIHFLNVLSEKLISCLLRILYYVIAFLFYVSLRN